MSDPLLAGDVWIAWDHTARLVRAFEQRPEEFFAFPAPIGPNGRGFMAVVSGLAIPKGVTYPDNPAILIDYLTRPEIQILTLKETGFFPVVSLGENEGVPIHLTALSMAVEKQISSKLSIPTLLPIGLGEQAGDYNNVFMLTFSEIVLDDKDIAGVLNVNAGELQRILTEQNAKCWLPDVSEERPCKIE
jgi:multiple sugar transport system substrate-binding protein